MKKRNFFMLCLWCCLSQMQGQITGDILEYDSVPEAMATGNPVTVTANKQISLNPGFHYASSSTRSVHFRLLCSTMPDSVDLVYNNTDPVLENSNKIYGRYGSPSSVNYSAIRVGEYYWMTTNFNHTNPHRRVYNSDYPYEPPLPKDEQMSSGNGDVGKENLYPLSDSIFDRYLHCIAIDNPVFPALQATKFNPDIQRFNEEYGLFYSRQSAAYMDIYGEMDESLEQPKSGWGLPSRPDFKQLFAMCHARMPGDGLREQDMRIDLAPSANNNDILFSNFSDGFNTGRHVYWFVGNDRYHFNLMPGGGRLNGGNWANGIDGDALNDTYEIKNDQGEVIDIKHKWEGEIGHFYHLFYSVKYYLKSDNGDIRNVDVNDYFDFYDAEGYHWMSIRWCRRLTDDELGYRLFADSEWDEEVTDIQKVGLLETPKSGYVELKPGYLRGFYVQYILNKSYPQKTVAQIVELARLTECQQTRNDEIRPSCYVSSPSTRDAAFNPSVEDYGDASTLEQAAVKPLFIYPNPTADILNIDAETPVVSVKVYNAMGGLVRTFSDVKENIDLSPLAAGVYTLIIQTNDETATFKVMKR